MEHTVKAFDEDITQLRGLIAEMGGLAQLSVTEAITALETGDNDLAQKVRKRDAQINALEAEIDRLAVRLIALRAPRPLMIATGRAEQGDGWTDPHGQWLATLSARAAWRVTGAEIFAQAERPEPGSGPVEAPLAFWQHGEGHVMWPAYQPFFDHAERFATPERPSRSAATPAPHRN